MHKVNFLSLTFDVQDLGEWLRLLGRASSWDGFDYIVTPNVYHVVGYHETSFPIDAYDAARFKICDSRILSKLAKFKGLILPALPGSDLVREFLSSQEAKTLRIAILGPSEEDYAILAKNFSAVKLNYIPAPLGLKPRSPAWYEVITALKNDPFDVLLCCISFPKQELICRDLKACGKDRGLAICGGASIDFLVGRQTRAPIKWQRLHLEWLFRILADPRRLLPRYAKCIKIFWIFLKSVDDRVRTY